MNVKELIALFSAVIIIVVSFSSCSVTGNFDVVTELETENISTTISETTTGKEPEEKRIYVIDTEDGTPLNMRRGAGEDYGVLISIPDGKEVIVNDEKDGWGLVTYNGYTGWIKLEYAEKETATSTTAVAGESKETTSTVASTQSDYAYSYAGFNPKVISIDEKNWNLTLLNRHYTLPDGYVPKLAEAVKGSGVYLDYRVAPHYQEMYDAAKKDGITLTPNSGYRSFEHQKNNFENRIDKFISQGYDKITATQNAARINLLPGTSEHNAGFAMDIGWVTQDFEKSSAFAWLNEHAQDYGFILRYPKSESKQAITEIIYEPWHWRYVGVEAAKEMKASGQVLEEYLGKA